MIYTVTQIKQGTGFRRGARFISVEPYHPEARPVLTDLDARIAAAQRDANRLREQLIVAEEFVSELCKQALQVPQGTIEDDEDDDEPDTDHYVYDSLEDYSAPVD